MSLADRPAAGKPRRLSLAEQALGVERVAQLRRMRPVLTYELLPEDRRERCPPPHGPEQAVLDQWCWAVAGDPERVRRLLLRLLEDDIADAVAEAVRGGRP